LGRDLLHLVKVRQEEEGDRQPQDAGEEEEGEDGLTSFFLLPSISLGVARLEALATKLGTEVRKPIWTSLAPRATEAGGVVSAQPLVYGPADPVLNAVPQALPSPLLQALASFSNIQR
jgi:hypothetical protein